MNRRNFLATIIAAVVGGTCKSCDCKDRLPEKPKTDRELWNMACDSVVTDIIKTNHPTWRFLPPSPPIDWFYMGSGRSKSDIVRNAVGEPAATHFMDFMELNS